MDEFRTIIALLALVAYFWGRASWRAYKLKEGL
jgi:hypothetical protein